MRRKVACPLFLLLVAGPALAAERVGDSFFLQPAGRATYVAYDSRNDVYLVLSGNERIHARFVSMDGVALGSGPLLVQSSQAYSHFPRAAFSPEADGGKGAFLVTWHESDLPGDVTSVHARVLSHTGGLLTSDGVISGNPSYHEAGPNLAYAPAHGVFLVAWASGEDIHARRVSKDGAPLGGVIAVTATSVGERDPSVAYDSVRDEFVVAFSGYGGDPPAFVAVQRVSPATGALVGPALSLQGTSATYMTDVAFDPVQQRALVVWYQASPNGIHGRFVAGPDVISGVLTLSTVFYGYDSVSLAYSRLTGTYLLASHDNTSSENGGVEISAAGVPGPPTTFTALGGMGNFYPRLAASGSRPEWLLTTTHAFSTVAAQRIRGVALASPDADGDGFRVVDGDCDDTRPEAFPGAPELCNGLDDDCDGTVPAGEAPDGDGFRSCDPVEWLDPVSVAETAAGLRYGYYEGSWSSLPNLSEQTPVATGVTSGLDLSVRLREDHFALRFVGLLEVPVEGVYTFALRSDDGSWLFLGGRQVVDNDGIHPLERRAGRVGLRAGLHPLRVELFEADGEQSLEVLWRSAGGAEEPLPESALWHVPDEEPPQPKPDAGTSPSTELRGSCGCSAAGAPLAGALALALALRRRRPC